MGIVAVINKYSRKNEVRLAIKAGIIASTGIGLIILLYNT